MTNIILTSDIHLSDKAPSSCVETYTDDLFDMLDHIKNMCTYYSAPLVIGGDLFHIKVGSRNSHELVKRTIEKFKGFPYGVIAVVGNHDIVNDRIESLQAQPLGVLEASGAVSILNGWHADLPIYGVPWLQRFTDSNVKNALGSWREKNLDPALVICHAPIYPAGKELPYENYSVTKWASYMSNHGSVFYGHVHDPHGIYKEGGVTFCNNGSLSRGALTESHLKREVAITQWSSLNGQFKRIVIPHKPAQEVFRLQEVEVLKDSKIKFDDFLNSVGSVTLGTTSIASVIEHIKTLDIDPAVYGIIETLLREADS